MYALAGFEAEFMSVGIVAVGKLLVASRGECEALCAVSVAFEDPHLRIGIAQSKNASDVHFSVWVSLLRLQTACT